MKFVTSMNRDIFKAYGGRFLASWEKHSELPLTVYYEDGKAPANGTDLVSWRALRRVQGYTEYQDVTRRKPIFSGMIPGKGRSYLLDTHRFSRKVYAQLGMAERMLLENDFQPLWWIDCDVEVTDSVSERWFERQIEGYDIAIMNRPEWHLCASLIGWDLASPQAKQFFTALRVVYDSGFIFTLPHWDDSSVMQNGVMPLIEGLRVRNMAEPYMEQMKGPDNVFDRVVPFARHLKGNLKHREAAA